MADLNKLRGAWFDGDKENLSKLKPPYWIDDQPDPLHTKEDVEELFRMVDELKAKRLAEAVRKASLN